MPEKVDPAELDIRPLVEDCPRDRFKCGVSEIDRWFAKKVWKHHVASKYRTVTAHLGGNNHPCGFYSLRVSSGDVKHLCAEDSERHGPADNFPAVQLTFVAVDRSMHGLGIGRLLMGHAMESVHTIATLAGTFAMTLVAIDEERAQFYESLGFKRYGPEQDRPMMLLPVETLFDLFGRA
jgi:GNAT superfamily N-acetyltransferase